MLPDIMLSSTAQTQPSFQAPYSHHNAEGLIVLPSCLGSMETKAGKGLMELYLPVLLNELQLLDNGEARRTHKEPGIWQRLNGEGNKRPEVKTVQAALHLLYYRINGRAAAKKDLRGCWPITESSQQKEFKALMHAWVRELAGAGRLPPQTAKFFVTGYQTWGARTVELLFHLALLAMETELGRAYPQALSTSAPGLQDAHPLAFDLALAEEQLRQGKEQRRLQQLLSVVQQAQQLLAASAKAVASSNAGGGLLPWWSTSQAHADRVAAIQQVAPSLCAAAVADLGGLDSLLRPTAAAAEAARQGTQPTAVAAAAAVEGSGVGSSEANPAAICMVMGLRLAPPARPANRPGGSVDCTAVVSRLAMAQLHLGAAVLEMEHNLRQRQQAASVSTTQCQQPAGVGTPRSVLQLLPPSPPRPNPVMEALRCATAGLVSLWDAVPSGSASSGAAEEARQGVWAAVRSREARIAAQQAHQHAGSTAAEAAAPAHSPSPALTPPPSLRLHAAAEQQVISPALLGSAAGGRQLQSGADALPSPTLSQILESSKGGTFLLSPADSSGRGSAASSRGWGGAGGGFSLPPSLPITPRLGSSSPGQARGSDTQRETCTGGFSPQALQPSQQEQQPPDSPCFAESIASFSVFAGGVASAAEAQGLQHRGGASEAGQGASRGLRPVTETTSPATSAAASVVPAAASLRPHSSSATSSRTPTAQLGPTAGAVEAGAGRAGAVGAPMQCPDAEQAQRPFKVNAEDDGAPTPESKVHCFRGIPDAGTPCSQGAAAGCAAAPSIPPAAAAWDGAGSGDRGFEAVLARGREARAQPSAAFSPPRPLSDSPLPAARPPAPPGSSAAGGSPGRKPSASLEAAVRRRSALVVTTSSPIKPRKPLPVALPLEVLGSLPPAAAGAEGSSPAASECSQGTHSMYSPPKALASPAGSIFSRGQLTLQDMSNSGQGPAALSSSLAKGNDIGGLMERFAKLRAQKQQSVRGPS